MKIKIKHTMAAILATTAAAFSLPIPAQQQQQQRVEPSAQETQESREFATQQAPAALQENINSHPEWVRAVVQRANEDLGKLTLKHEPIASLDMPAMTMVFQVADKAWLKGLQAGTTVQVQIRKPSSYFVVTALNTSIAPEKIATGHEPAQT